MKRYNAVQARNNGIDNMTENQKHIVQCAKLLSVYSGASNEIFDIVGSVEYVAFLQKLCLSIKEKHFFGTSQCKRE